jgi:16S rRNA processing protein RimM
MTSENANSSADSWIDIGVLTRAHGLKGGIFLKANDRRTEFGDYPRILLTSPTQSREYFVKESYVSAGQPVLVLEGVTSREAAEALLHCRVSVSREDIVEDEDDVLVGDLIGLKVVAEGKGEIGEVVAVVNYGAQENIEIRMEGRKSTAVFPLLDEYVNEIDIEKGIISIQYVPEFLEENG